MKDILYPSDSNNFFNLYKSRFTLNEGLYYSNSPLIVKFENNESLLKQGSVYSSYFGYNLLRISFIFKDSFTNNAVDFSFKINDLEFSNSTIINSKNLFLKSNNFSSVITSIKNMFENYEMFDSYNIVLTYDGDSKIVIELTSKIAGNKFQLTATNSYVTTNVNNDTNLTIQKTGNYPTDYGNKAFSFYNFNYLGNTMNDDVNNFGSGIVIFNKDNLKIATLLKKENDIVDFDINSICRNYIDTFTPHLNIFNICKEIDSFTFKEVIQYTDNRIDVDNNYIQTFTNNSRIYKFNLIEGTTKNINDNNYILSDYTSDFNSDVYLKNGLKANSFENSGTYGDSSILNYLINDRLLTNQPRRKKLNKSFESLYVINKNNSTTKQLNVNIKFVNYAGFIDAVDLSYSQINSSKMFINEYSISFEYLSYLVDVNFSQSILNYKEIIIQFSTDSYLVDGDFYIVKYEPMTYYLDNTESFCIDNTNVNFDYFPLIFKNQKGGYDIFEFDEIVEMNSNRKIEYIDIPFDYTFNEFSEYKKIWNFEYNKTYKLTTRILDDEEFIWLEDLVKSKQVYVIDLNNNNNLIPILILNSDYSFKKDSDKQISIEFIYQKTEQI